MVRTSLSILSSTIPSSFSSNSNSFNYTPSLSKFPNPNPNSLKPLPKLRFRRLKPCANQSVVEDGSADQFLENNSIADFMRFKAGTSSGAAELQTAVVSYRKKFPWSLLQPFLQVDLVSTIHIGDKEVICDALISTRSEFMNKSKLGFWTFYPKLIVIHPNHGRYFETLQKELEPYDCVLYEMVASRECLESRMNTLRTAKPKTQSPGFSIIGFIQRQMANILMLDFQLDCVNYQAQNWYHADLDYETFKLLQQEKGESLFTFARDMTIQSTKSMLQTISVPKDLGFWRSNLLRASRVLPMPLVGFFLIGTLCSDFESSASEYPELRALSTLDFGAAMKLFLAKRLASDFGQGTSDVEENSVVIGERNRAAIEALKRSLNEGHNKIAILYGGGHMPDLGRRLREEFNLIPSQVQWVTAWYIKNRNINNNNSLPFLKKMAELSGWPLNRYQTLALILFSSVLALDLLFWELFLDTTVNWISHLGSDVLQF